MPVPVEIFLDTGWQMSLGERAAVEGILSRLRPRLAVEIGSAQGACLQRIAAHAQEVHSFDLTAPSLPQPSHVTLHTGDSHALLPEFLAEMAEQERNVDFVMVDGDHSPEGVRRDLEDLLDSPALAHTAILIHDTANERVRQGIDSVRFTAWPKVAHVELDWIPGRLFAEPGLRNELWYGLGLVWVDVTAPGYRTGPVHEQRYFPSAPLLAEIRELSVAREGLAGTHRSELEQLRGRVEVLGRELAVARTRGAALQSELGVARDAVEAADREREEAQALRERDARTLQDLTDSVSWRITKPLRGAKRHAPRRAG